MENIDELKRKRVKFHDDVAYRTGKAKGNGGVAIDASMFLCGTQPLKIVEPTQTGTQPSTAGVCVEKSNVPADPKMPSQQWVYLGKEILDKLNSSSDKGPRWEANQQFILQDQGKNIYITVASEDRDVEETKRKLQEKKISSSKNT